MDIGNQSWVTGKGWWKRRQGGPAHLKHQLVGCNDMTTTGCVISGMHLFCGASSRAPTQLIPRDGDDDGNADEIMGVPGCCAEMTLVAELC